MAIRNPLEPVVHHHPLSRHEAASVAAAALLGHEFTRPELLAEALTHRSAAAAGGMDSNERLEFIGDRVLGLLIAEWLIARFPKEREGALGPRLAYLVSRPSLAAIAEAIGLPALLSVAPGEVKRGIRNRATVMADALEALIGALYLDGGLTAARGFIHKSFGPVMAAQETLPPKDAKTALQEWALKRSTVLPEYQLVERSGPPHAPEFVIRAIVGEASAEGRAATKRAAETAAAAALLLMLGSSP